MPLRLFRGLLRLLLSQCFPQLLPDGVRQGRGHGVPNLAVLGLDRAVESELVGETLWVHKRYRHTPSPHPHPFTFAIMQS